jgi:hypothetical protein
MFTASSTVGAAPPRAAASPRAGVLGAPDCTVAWTLVQRDEAQ